MPIPEPAIRLSGVSKAFAGSQALDAVDFDCEAGSIHAILGENGAGKSTLIKILAGVLRPDTGEVRLGGRPVRFGSSAEAAAAGIVCVFQELSLIPDLTVAENISVADPPRRFGLIDGGAQRHRAKAVLARIGCDGLDPEMPVRDLSLSRRQMVEVAKALARDPKGLILDEATSALGAQDVETVYRLLADLRARGGSCLFISHRMHEVDRLCDRLSVFRNGRHVETFARGTRSAPEIVRMMIGRDIAAHFPPKPAPAPRAPHLKIDDLRWPPRLTGVDLALGRGEILGLGGLDGQGQKELPLALFGVLRGGSGRVTLGGRTGLPGSPAAARRPPARIALVPEDRKTEGPMLPMSIADNLLAASYDRVSREGIVSPAREAAAVREAIAHLRIKAARPSDAVATLSGGNQQKVVIARWLMTDPDVILLNDPTRGIDMGTKQEIYALMRVLADRGKAILFYSTDYAELIGCADRVAVMSDGRIAAELSGTALTEEALLGAALNIGPSRAPAEALA